MKSRKVSVGVALLAALLAVWLLALAPVAAATPTTSPTASPTPAVGKVPTNISADPTNQGTSVSWGGKSVTVYYTAGSSPIDPTLCELYIDGKRVPLAGLPIDSSFANGYRLQFSFAASFTPPSGTVNFKAILVTKAGDKVPYEWTFGNSQGSAAPVLISFPTIRQWWWFITKGGLVTVELTVISIAIAVVLALLGALGRLSRSMSFSMAWNKYHSWGYMGVHFVRTIPYWAATFYTSLFRGTPLLLQIYAIYNAVPAFNLWLGAKWHVWTNVPIYPSAFWSGVAALSLNYGAYLTEVFRAGIQAVPKGQVEAAWALGLKAGQTQRRIVLPQAFKIVIPAVGNDFIALIKDTSLVSTITVAELLERANLVGGATLQFFSALLVAAAVYWALTIFFSFWQSRLERRMEHDRARA